MLLVVDVGNTHITLGLFDGKENAEKLVQKLKKKGIASFIKEL